MAGKPWLLITGIIGLLAGSGVFGLGLWRAMRELDRETGTRPKPLPKVLAPANATTQVRDAARAHWQNATTRANERRQRAPRLRGDQVLRRRDDGALRDRPGQHVAGA
mmetsp:Transcript_32536/g.103752  ORF Transcript_32536/g.103752 Transcript_32536/m.103752 type:complete len:108 (-) Transcript_32536:171-494(-)|eukprot:CAMPEP_0118907772 /NCGR_PEP_ID=MMETSP1166-20130328/11075_1 /TAXON_ID=1104430 /ORGANISM="Chrysoreinhardia sp, Strain CCMP3193" /LENGTH=107 /DNA_ID=CAMNT_0006847147 /DNA_START=49 /DNA_END=372 /DNA_ORIENTATION=+